MTNNSNLPKTQPNKNRGEAAMDSGLQSDQKTATTERKCETWLSRPVPRVKRHSLPQLTAVETEPSTQCPQCHSMTTNTALIFNSYVCPHCDHHLAMTARERLADFLDQVEQELGQQFHAGDPLTFVDSKPYPQRMQQMQEKTGESEALIVFKGKLRKMDVVACAFDFRFMGGSMGSVVGDRFVQAAEVALEQKTPLICFAASGGARMQEGVLSLMQMARTAAAIERLRLAGVPYIVVLTNPVYGGVTASLAMLGDIHIAEPKAMIGFAGKRVIEQTVRQTLEEPFQRAEYLLEHGMIDQVVHRHQLNDTVHRLLAKLMPS